MYKDLDAGLQKGIQRITTFAESATPSLSKFAPAERQLVKFARVQKEIEQASAITRAELEALVNQATGAKKLQYQNLIDLLDSGGGTELLNGRRSVRQLVNSKESRTAKLLHEDLQQQIIRTRAEVVYGPADQATIDALKSNPELSAKLNAFKAKNPNLLDESVGWELKMDTFSTPGAVGETVGADRDARLVFQRFLKDAEGKLVIDAKSGFPKVERIEVPLEMWEKQAYADFRARTLQLYGGELPPDVANLVNAKVKELQYLKGRPNGPTSKSSTALWAKLTISCSRIVSTWKPAPRTPIN